MADAQFTVSLEERSLSPVTCKRERRRRVGGGRPVNPLSGAPLSDNIAEQSHARPVALRRMIKIGIRLD